MKKYHSKIAFLLLVFSVLVVSAQAEDKRIETYRKHFQQGSLSLQIKTCQKIADYSGIVDEPLFDLIEEKLLTLARADKLNREQTKAAVWYVNALASSGNKKYKETLKNVSENASKRKVRKNAAQSIADIEKFSRWNTVINGTEFETAGRSRAVALWMRMLASAQPDMGKYAVNKAKAFAEYDVNLLILAEERLNAIHTAADITEEQSEVAGEIMAYLMSHPEFGKYADLINDIAETSKNEGIVRSARKALRQ